VKEIAFSVPVSGVIRLDGNSITVVINRASTNVLMEEGTGSREHTVFEPGVSMFDILLESAREYIRRKTYNRFTVSQLYEIAKEKYPSLNKRSFTTRLTAATPNHPSFKYHVSHKDFFSRVAPGIYSLENPYLPEKLSSEVDSSDSESQREEIL
jgi:hypothetical protein